MRVEQSVPLAAETEDIGISTKKYVFSFCVCFSLDSVAFGVCWLLAFRSFWPGPRARVQNGPEVPSAEGWGPRARRLQGAEGPLFSK